MKNIIFPAIVMLTALSTTPAFAQMASASTSAKPTPATIQPADEASTNSDQINTDTTIDHDAARYEKREQSAKPQADYEGGNRVVIVTSTGTLILGLILLLILI